jgi:hypothetical protein
LHNCAIGLRQGVIQVYESKVLEVLFKMSATLRWLEHNQPAERLQLPVEHSDAIKRLEDMGIVTRRSHHLLSLQKQRLQKLLGKELMRCPRLKERCLSEFSDLFEPTTF